MTNNIQKRRQRPGYTALRSLAALTAALLCIILGLSRAASADVVDLKTRDTSIRLLIEGPANPSHVIALFSGGHGGVEIHDDGSIGVGSGNFAIRTRTLFHAHGMATAVLSAPGDIDMLDGKLFGRRGRDEYATDVATVIAYLHKRFDKPVWLHGTSSGTTGIALTVPKITGKDQKPDGIILSSSVTKKNKDNLVFDGAIEKIGGPVLVLHHKEDACRITPPGGVEKILAKLDAAAPKKALFFDGGADKVSGKECGQTSFHGFVGIEQKVIDTAVLFIRNPS